MDNRKRVVVVEDDKDIRLLIVTRLESLGFETHWAGDGESGIQRSKDVCPDLIVLDVLLPGIDGFEVCKRLKADPCTRSIPILFLTSQDMDSQRAKSYEVGGSLYLTKPFDATMLITCVNKLMRH